jgi:hypothetical protein
VSLGYRIISLLPFVVGEEILMASSGRREYWDRVVSEQRASGLTGRSWCQENGVALASFYLWRKKLTATPAARTSARDSSDIRWLSVESMKSTAGSAPAPSGVTLRVGGVRVEIATDFNPRALSDVLTLLESRC